MKIKNIVSIDNRVKYIRISLYIIVFIIICLIASILTNTSVAIDASTTFVYNKNKNSEKSEISFSNDSSYIYFNIDLPNIQEGETYYTTVDIKGNKIWQEVTGKNITFLLEKSTNGSDYIKEKDIALNSNNSINILNKSRLNSKKTYYRLSIKADNTSIKIDSRNVDFNLTVKTEISFDYEYKEKSQLFEVPFSDSFKIELWGAAGNYYPVEMKNEVGLGAYTSGTINLTKGEKLYIYTGKNATDEGTFYSASFNSGSTAAGIKTYSDVFGSGYHNSSSGGGSTDIRLTSGEWNNEESLNSRIMVAAGGGGTQYFDHFSSGTKIGEVHGLGGSGGGLVGYRGSQEIYIYTKDININYLEYDGSVTKVMYNVPFAYTSGGAQTSGGLTNKCNSQNRCETLAGGSSGAFGISGNGSSLEAGGGGGGGYYGGAGGGAAVDSDDIGWCHSSGAGGSSYISGHTGSIAITSVSNQNPKSGCSETGSHPENYIGTTNNECSIHYSGMKFTDTVMIDGEGYNWTNKRESKTTMPSFDDTTLTKGNIGSGAARITSLSSLSESVATKQSYVMITSNYVDEKGKSIAQSESFLKDTGDSYTTENKKIEGYILKEVPSNAEGTVGNVDIVVTYQYLKLLDVVYRSDENGEITGITQEEVVPKHNPSGSNTKSKPGYCDAKGWKADKKVILKDQTIIENDSLLTIEQVKQIVVTEDLVLTAIHDRCFGTLSILKLDYKTEKPVKGVEFALYDKDGSTIAKDIFGNDILKQETLDNGIVEFVNIPYGNYILKETKSNDWYEPLTKPISVEFGKTQDTLNFENSNDSSDNNSEVESIKETIATSFVITNMPIDIKLYKKELKTNKLLNGAKFEILDSEGNLFRTVKMAESMENIAIPIGEYILKETEYPDGYKNTNLEIKFKIDKEGNINLLQNSKMYKLQKSQEENDNDLDNIIIYNEKQEIVKIPHTGINKNIIPTIISVLFIATTFYMIYSRYKSYNLSK